MVEEAKKEEEKVEAKKEEKVVTLSESQYAALLDRVAELEDVSLSKGKKEIYDVDELAEEGKRPEVKPKEEEVDWDALSNKELVERIVGSVNEAGVGLVTKIETLKVLREIDKGEAKHKDFWDYEKDIRKIASENPTLSIEDAYQLAKAKKGGGKEEKKEGEKGEEVGAKTTRTEKLLNLPPRGEKPGVVSSSTREGKVKTLREAADRAWDEAVGKGKESI